MALSDYQARKIIIEQLNKNIFVMAGAGSGKTHILVDRMVMMVEKGFDISKICTITFTVNAASEFLARFSQKLKERSELTINEYYASNYKDSIFLPPPSDISRYRCQEALKQIDLAFMGTIDAFCQQIVSEHPYEAQVPSSASVISEEEQDWLYQKEFDNILIRHGVYDDNVLQKSLREFCLLHDKPSQVFISSIKDIINKSCLEIVEQPSYNNSISLEQQYRLIIDKYRCSIVDDLQLVYQFCEKAVIENKKETWDDLVSYQSLFLQDWPLAKTKFIVDQLVNLLGKLRFIDDPILFVPRSFKILEFKKVTNRKTYQWDQDLSPLSELQKDIDCLLYDHSLPFLKRASLLIKQKLQKEGKLTFDQWIMCVKKILENDISNNHSKLIEHISKRYQYFLIDESQDTSPFQMQIFEMIVNHSQEKCTLFIVGDPKQSIYRFRGADDVSYETMRKKYYQIKSIDEVDKYQNIQVELLRNFRSSKEMKQYFNNAFASSFSHYTNIEIPKEENDSGYHSGAYEYEANQLCDIIKTMVDNENYQAYNKSLERFEKLQYRDFMLITYTKTQLENTINLLMKNNIPFYCEGKNDVFNHPLVKTVYAIYAYVALQNRSTLLNLLTSSLFDLSLEDSLMVKTDNNLLENIKNKQKQVDFINRLIKESTTLSPLFLYHLILENINLIHADRLDKIDYLFFIEEKMKEALDHHLLASILDGEYFLRQYLSSNIERLSNLSYQPNAVYLANLHKVKGLQSAVVILIYANKKSQTLESRFDFINEKSYIFKSAKNKHNKYLINSDCSLFDEQQEKEKLALIQEEQRLLYVAATRAKNYLLIPQKAQAWKGLLRDQQFPLPACLTQNQNNNVEPVNINQLINEVKPSFNDQPTYILQKPSSLDFDLRINKNDDEVAFDHNEYNFLRDEATTIGTIVHRLMEKIALALPLQIDQNQLVDEIMKQYDLRDQQYKDILNNVYQNIVLYHGYQQDSNNAPSDIYQVLKTAKQVMCEVPFCYKENNSLFNGFIDLIYEDENGYHIVDYKSDEILSSHQYQLRAYQKALKVLFNVEADAKIYHIKIK